MVLRVLGALLVIWLAFMFLGAIVHGLIVLAVIGGIAFLGTAGYMAIRNRSDRKRLH